MSDIQEAWQQLHMESRIVLRLVTGLDGLVDDEALDYQVDRFSDALAAMRDAFDAEAESAT